jgi:hypothetical protein
MVRCYFVVHVTPTGCGGCYVCYQNSFCNPHYVPACRYCLTDETAEHGLFSQEHSVLARLQLGSY